MSDDEKDLDQYATNTGILKLLSQQRKMIEDQQAAMDIQRDAMETQNKVLQAMLTKLTGAPFNPEGHANGGGPVVYNQDRLADSISKCITSEFIYDPDANVTFKLWFSKYRDLFEEDAKDLDDAKKVRMLLRKLGTREHQQYVAHVLPKEPKEFNFKETVETLERRFGLKETLFRSRFKCLRVAKTSSEDYFTYAGRINTLVDKMVYKKMTEDEFKCLLYVVGLNSHEENDVREKLLALLEKKSIETSEADGADGDAEAQAEDRKLTIDQLVTASERFVSLRADNKEIEHCAAPAMTKSIKGKSQRNSRKPTPADHGNKQKYMCFGCGSAHQLSECKFTKNYCDVCDKHGHKAGFCSKNKSAFVVKEIKPTTKSVKAVYESESLVQENRRYVDVSIMGTRMKLQFDTASDPTIISYTNWKRMDSPRLQQTDREVLSASGKAVTLLGVLTTAITHGNSAHSGEIYVTSDKSLNVFGIDFITRFGYWSIPLDRVCNSMSFQIASPTAQGKDAIELESEFPKVFTGKLGHCTKVKPKLVLKSDARPVFINKRPVPFASAPLLDETLTRLESSGVITKIEYSEWAAPIVAVRKTNGDIRPCADFSTGLNAALEPHTHPLPTPEEIFATMAGNKIFTHIDLSDAYFQVEMDEESKQLLVINTHRGLFRFNRLSQGVKPATGIFQQIVDAMLSGIDGVSAFLDDIIIGGKTKEENLERTRDVLRRLEDYGFTLKIEKCKFLQPQLRFLGIILDEHGQHSDPDKIKAISNMPPPSNVSELRSFLGAINWYRKFVPNMSKLQAPLDDLLKKDAIFDWNDQCETSFKKFKELLASPMLLTHYDPSLQIIVSADASSVGIGATIAHKMRDGTKKIIAHASRSLTKAEKNYSQIEREALALIYAVTKFHRYI